ncbi:MAG: PDZ domain-containing protein [Planctomycetota bacterium]
MKSLRVAVRVLALSFLCCALPTSPVTAQERTDAPAVQPAQAKSRAADVLGVEFAVRSSKLRRAIIRTRTPWGFAVKAVRKDSLAAAAGLAKGDVVLEVDGAPLREVEELEKVLAGAAPGQKLVLKCSRRKAKTRWLDRHPWIELTIEIVLPKPPARRSV